VTRTSATNAGLLISLTVVLTPLMEGAAARRRLPRTFFVAVVVAVVGVALLVSADGLRAPTSGDALMLAAAFVRAAHVTASGGLTRGRPVRTLTLTLVQTWVCALGFALAAPGELAAAVGRAGAGQWWQLAYLGVAGTAWGQRVELRHRTAGRAGLGGSVVCGPPLQDPSATATSARQRREPMALDVGGLEDVIVLRTVAAVDAAGGNDLPGVEDVRVVGHGEDVPAVSPGSRTPRSRRRRGPGPFPWPGVPGWEVDRQDPGGDGP
jgi:hypothetical protein